MTSEINILEKYLKSGKKPTGGYIQDKVLETSLIEALMNNGSFSKIHSKISIEFNNKELVFRDDEADIAEELLKEFKCEDKIEKLTPVYAYS